MSNKNKGRHEDDEQRLKDETNGIAVEDNVIEQTDETVSQEQEEILESAETEIDKLTAKLTETEAALEKEKKEYLFLMAEFDNFRKNQMKARAELIKNAAETTLTGLLPIVDDFERGLEANAKVEDGQAIKEGMELIYRKLVSYLEKNGVKAMVTTGEVFDPDKHDAITTIPAPDEESKGRIVDTVTKGYTLNDKVIRHPKVVVAQ